MNRYLSLLGGLAMLAIASVWISSSSLAATTATTITAGETVVLSNGDSGNGNLLLAQEATLSESATIESLSFYVTAAAGNLVLGIYDATGPKGGPGALKAQTNGFKAVTGWNTASVVTPVALAAGNYWLAYLPSSNGLSFVGQSNSGAFAYYKHAYATTLPGKFSSKPTSCTPTTWSFYATFDVTTPPAACGSTPSGSTVTETVSTTTGSIAATTAQCPYGGTQPTTTTVTQLELCTNGTLSADGNPVSTTTDTGNPTCNAAAACGSTPSGSTVTETVSTTTGSIAATTAQCPYGGTQPTTTTVTQLELCTNGTLSADGSQVSTTTDTGSPTCKAAAACGSTPSGSTVTETLSTTTGSIAATTAQCPYGGTQPTTTTVTQLELCTNGTLSADGSQVSTTTDTGNPTCKAAAACGSTPSGSTVTETVSTTTGSIAATIAQCPYGGTQPTTTTVTQLELCTNGTLSADGSSVSTTANAGSPTCNAAAPISIMQSTYLGGYAAATVAPQFSKNVAAGDLILVMAVGSGGDTITVTDSGSNSYTQIGSGITQAGGQALSFWAKNTGGGGTDVTVTCHYSNSGKELCTILDISGAASSPIDAYSYSSFGGSSTASTNSFTNAYNGDLIIGQIMDANGGQNANFTAGTGYTIDIANQIYSGNNYFANEYSANTVSAGPQTVSFNNVVSNGQSTGPIFAVGIISSAGTIQPIQTETLTASAGSGGTISPSGSVVVNLGTNQTFTLTPNAGYTASLTVDGSSVTLTNNTYTLSNITAPHTLAASFVLSPINGACGSASGVSVSSAPGANLCSTGTASSVTGSGPWSWSCTGSNGGSTASCSAPLSSSSKNGQCGFSNDVYTNVAPTTGLCSTGTASAVSGSGPWTWTCAISGGTTASCEAFVGLLPPDRDVQANWQMAGLQSVGGIPNRTTICATVHPSGGDDTSNIQTAVDNCPSGEVVLLSAGTFTIAEGEAVTMSSSITLRGSGACAGTGIGSAPYSSSSQSYCTLIQRSGGAVLNQSQAGSSPSPHFIMGTGDFYGNVHEGTATDLTADGEQGSSTVSVGSTSGLSVGQIVLVVENANLNWETSWIWTGEMQWAEADYRLSWNAQNPTCADADKDCAGGSTNPGVPCYYGWQGVDCDGYTNEIKQIASINPGASTITFNSPLTISYRVAHTAHVAPVYGGGGTTGTTAPATYVGLENLTLQNADGGSVRMVACAYCWMKNTEDTIYFGYYSNGSIQVSAGFRDQLEGVYTHTAANPAPGGAGYNWSLDYASSEILIENSISMLADKVMVVRAAGAGSVFGYDYFDESILGGGSGETEVGANASHWIGTHHVLFEGNWTFQSSADPVWGPSIYDTWMRNDITGFRTPFYDYYDGFNINDATSTPGAVGGPTGNNGAIGIGIAGLDYWHSFIANVIGTPGQMTYWTFNGNGESQKIWSTGYFTGQSYIDGEVWSQIAGASACVSSTGDQCPLIRLGNYDYVTNSIADPGGSSSSFPNSLYLSGEPAFFTAGTGYAWPWVTPAGSSQVQSGPTTSGCTANVGGRCSGLPAKARIDNGTPFTQP